MTGDHQAPELEAPELLDVPLGEDLAAGADTDGPSEAPEGVVSREAFREGFNLAFRLGGSLSGLRTLQEAPQRPEAAPAADVLYDTALESTWLRWLIEPQAVWLQRVIVLAAFATPVATGTLAELRERKQAAAAARAKPVEPRPANDNRPPAPEPDAELGGGSHPV